MLLRYLGLAAALLVVYLPAVHGSFIFDDQAFILYNPVLHASDGLRRIWLSPGESGDYWPLSYSLLWVEWRLWGIHTTGYHVVGVLLHALNALLLAHALSLFRVPRAMLTAWLFALHPVNVEAVAWIVQTKTTLAFALCLASFLLYATWTERRTWPWYAAALASFALALLAKTAAAPLPAVLLVWHAWRRDVRPLRALLLCLPFFALAIAGGLTASWIERHGVRPEEFATDLTWSQRVVVAGKAYWFYLGKILFPVRLAFVYPRMEVDAAHAASYATFAGMGLVAAAAWALRKRPWGRPLFAANAYYTLMLVPVMGFLDISYMRYTFVADHWAYMAMPGVLAWIVGGATAAGDRWRGSRGLATAAHAAVAVTLAACAVLSWRQASLYRDAETLWTDTLRKNPGAWVAHYNLGVEYQARGEVQHAVEHYLRAVALKPDYARAEYNLGVGLSDLGRRDEAILHYRRAIASRPNYPRALCALGAALEAVGRPEEAAAALAEATRLQPIYPEAHGRLGSALLELGLGRERDAEAELRVAVSQDTGLVAAWTRLGRLYTAQGRAAEAEECFARARRATGR